MENHHAINGKTHYFDWAIFNSYVKLPEGIPFIHIHSSIIQEIPINLMVKTSQFPVKIFPTKSIH